MKKEIIKIAEKISFNESGYSHPLQSHIDYVTENIDSLEAIFNNNPNMEIECDKFLDWEEVQ